MRARSDQLPGLLTKGLKPVYMLTGDEPLQLHEGLDAIRAAARDAGYTEREVLEVDAGFDWGRLAALADNLSLFGDRRVVELRLPSGKPGQQGARAIGDYCKRPPDDTLLVIVSGKLEAKVRKSAAWVKTIDEAGVVVEIWPVEPAQLPRWLNARMQQAGLRPTPEALQLLAERGEGNLLAAVQEVEKLRLLVGDGNVDLATVQAAVADSARYDVFDLCTAALQGESRRVVRILGGLREEGVEPTLVLWALARELRVLVPLSARGANAKAVLNGAKVFGPRQAALQAAAGRGGPGRWSALLARAARADRVFKGAAAGRPWDELLHLSLAIAGTETVAVRTAIE